MNKDLQKILIRLSLMIIGCVVIGIICTFPYISSILFGYGWCMYILNKDRKN